MADINELVVAVDYDVDFVFGTGHAFRTGLLKRLSNLFHSPHFTLEPVRRKEL
jgi:hypothetical protein